MMPQVAQEEEVESLATCQLHKSWISDAEMIAPLSSSPSNFGAVTYGKEAAALPWVLSASNSGEIAIWNPAAVDIKGKFSQVVESTDCTQEGNFWHAPVPAARAWEGRKKQYK
jgi:hypothetical protein